LRRFIIKPLCLKIRWSLFFAFLTHNWNSNEEMSRTLLETWRRFVWANKNFSIKISPEVSAKVGRKFINLSSTSKFRSSCLRKRASPIFWLKNDASIIQIDNATVNSPLLANSSLSMLVATVRGDLDFKIQKTMQLLSSQ